LNILSRSLELDPINPSLASAAAKAVKQAVEQAPQRKRALWRKLKKHSTRPHDEARTLPGTG
jgi:hypothetical protein